MANKSSTESDQAYVRSQFIKLGIAGAVIIACAIWLGYLVFSSPKPEFAATTPTLRLTQHVAKLFDNERFGFVTMHPSEDGTSMTLTGTVKNAAELEELKKGFEAANAEVSKLGPAAKIVWEIKARN